MKISGFRKLNGKLKNNASDLETFAQKLLYNLS